MYVVSAGLPSAAHPPQLHRNECRISNGWARAAAISCSFFLINYCSEESIRCVIKYTLNFEPVVVNE